MTWLILLYIAFLVSGFAVMKTQNIGRKEKILFVTITTIGCILWGSLVLHRPLDLNKAIGMAIDFIF
ncbi:hypothetical protein [Paenibacillus sp. CF384]|uniref:hypothetical protein n=1 Tax=Paenibacillus sp. CF384 TaxID=1884382 RepID=UPI0008946D5D|nr:hypothetical protein [Paenibacillus sp. CF384]SDW07680.1 hypothetical protein SAMN05518855_1001180 [Paenibacillus sp. CF384]